MADTAAVSVETNGYRNVVLRVTLQSDGTGITRQKIYDATSAGSYGVLYAGATYYPGLHTTVIGLDYDVQDMKCILEWDATPTPGPLLNLGNAPEDFDWTRFGGIRVPSSLTGATGSILLSTTEQLVGATLSFILYLRKNVPA